MSEREEALRQLIELQCDNFATGTQDRDFLRDDEDNEPYWREMLRLNLEQFAKSLARAQEPDPREVSAVQGLIAIGVIPNEPARAQPQQEPVAWRFRTVVADFEGDWHASIGHPSNFIRGREEETQVEPLCRCSPPAQAGAEGFVLVPRDPPQEMLDAWTRKSMLRASVRECYQSMLSAAPHPATKREGE